MANGAAISGWTGAIGSAFQQRAQMEANKEVSMAKTQAMLRQQGFADQAGKIVSKQAKQQGSESAKQAMVEGQAKRQVALDNVQKVDLFGQNQAQMNPVDMLRTRITGRNRAVLGSYGDWALRDLIGKIQIQNELNKLYGQASGQANIIDPYLENEAEHSADAWKMVGGTISGAGNVVGSYYANKGDQQKAPTYVAPKNSTSAPWVSGSNEQYLQFNNVS